MRMSPDELAARRYVTEPCGSGSLRRVGQRHAEALISEIDRTRAQLREAAEEIEHYARERAALRAASDEAEERGARWALAWIAREMSETLWKRIRDDEWLPDVMADGGWASPVGTRCSDVLSGVGRAADHARRADPAAACAAGREAAARAREKQGGPLDTLLDTKGKR